MICVQMSGGLGNQMLQFAAAKALSLHHKVKLVLDTSRLDYAMFGPKETPRNFELDIFHDCKAASRIDYPILKPFKNVPKVLPHVYVMARKMYLRHNGLQLKDCRKMHRASDFFSLPDDTYLSGHFVSESFFKPFAEEIKEVFTFQEPSNPVNRQLITEMRKNRSVSIHVRRTDYLNATNSSHFAVCGPEYYHAAIQFMEEKSASPHYYLFSDDVRWASENLPLPRGRFTAINHNTGGSSFEDMHLMSCCDHNITANSTFSWWGAWLNAESAKMVTIPKKWYKKYSGPLEDMIIPEGWLPL